MQSIFPATAMRLAQWQEQAEVSGVLLVGSKSRGHSDDLSDDDLEVLLSEAAHAQLKPVECGEYVFEGEGTQRKLIYDIEYTSLKDLQSKLSSPYDLDHWPYERARVLFDRHGDVAPTVTALARMDAGYRHTRLLYSTIGTSGAIGRANKTLERGNAGAGHMLIARGAKALARLLFALEWRWVPLDHWLENELRTLQDPTHSGPLLVEALVSGSPAPLREALNRLEDTLAAEGVARPAERTQLFLELIHPSRQADMAIHGMF